MMDEGKKYIRKKEIYRKLGFGTPNTSESDLEFHPVCKIVYKKREEFNKKYCLASYYKHTKNIGQGNKGVVWNFQF